MATTDTTPPDTTFAALADLVEEHYVLDDLARVYADRIRDHAAHLAGHLPDLHAVNAALHTHVPDQHLCLRRPEPTDAEPGRVTPSEPPAGGVNRIQFLDHDVCLVEIHPIFTAREHALPALQATAQLTAQARGLILDLRRRFGGDTDTAALIHAWLLGPSPVHLGRFEHRGHPSSDYTSDPTIGTYYAGPVRILTSAATFSGGEDIAYVQQALGRARVIGEQTRGGAHPVEHFELPQGRMCQIPVARSVIQATASNWEGTGVSPDVTCSPDQALELAHNEFASTPKPHPTSKIWTSAR